MCICLSEFDIVLADSPGHDFHAEGDVNIARLIGIVGIFGIVIRQARMTQTVDVGNREFVNIVAHNSEFHVAHHAVVSIVVVTVPVEIVAIVAPAVFFILARLIKGDAVGCGGFLEFLQQVVRRFPALFHCAHL